MNKKFVLFGILTSILIGSSSGIFTIENSFAEDNLSVSGASWIKDNAGWWADGEIDDDTFVDAIEYFITNGIMQI